MVITLESGKRFFIFLAIVGISSGFAISSTISVTSFLFIPKISKTKSFGIRIMSFDSSAVALLNVEAIFIFLSSPSGFIKLKTPW